jgi:hypothetical protein
MVVSQASAQEVFIKIEKIKPAASKALDTFGGIITEQNYMQMGFKSTEEVKTAQLGVPFQEFMVRLDQLQKYESGVDPNQLLSGGQIVYFPVNVQNETRSSIMMIKEKEHWKAISYGSANLVKLLSSTRSRLERTTDISISSFFVVRIPALNLYFVGYHKNQQLMLTPILDNTEYKFKSRIPISGQEVFKTLLPFAKSHDGLPG